MTDLRAPAWAPLRATAPLVALAAIPFVLALRFGGYHPRHAGWAVLAMAAWACVQGARGRLAAPRSVAGVASGALLALVAWTAASIAWADVSSHDAWVEAARSAGYAAAFVLGVSLLAGARSYVRFATLVAGSIALVGLITVARLAAGDDPLEHFVAGRLDWPMGYAPGLAGSYLFGMLLLLGISCAAERRWMEHTRAPLDLAVGGLALGGAGLCASLAWLAQSRGTLPALAVGIAVSLVVVPTRAAWLLRLGLLVVGLAAVHGQLGEPFQAQFALRQAPFTEGADAEALLATAEGAAQAAARACLVLAAGLALAGAALPHLGEWLLDTADAFEERTGRSVPVLGSIAAGALVVVLFAGAVAADRSPVRWVSDQWEGCTDPPERVNDPGSSSSYFANTGTGRCDYYRVALGNVRDAPVAGLGAGNFRGAYVRERRTAEEPRVAHSLPLQLLGELGLVGAALGAVVLGCVVVAARRFVASGLGRDPAFAAAIGALGYWFAHASIDWLWQLPAVSIPALVLAGGLVACVSPPQGATRPRVAVPVAAGVALACATLVLPVTMADSALRRARDPQVRADEPEVALEAAREAQGYDPAWAEPAITEGVLHLAAGRREEAAEAGRRAVRLEPDSWSVQYRASGLIGLDSTQEGLEAFQAARRLNPQLQSTVDADAPAPGREGPDPGPDSLQDPDA